MAVHWKAQIEVLLKNSVVDPQGTAVEKALGGMGYSNVRKVRVGKHLELDIYGVGQEEAARQIEEMCTRLLTNPVIEIYRYSLSEVKS